MVSGLLLVDKPKGLTSMEVVEGIKRRFRLKAGHAGTLDPIATGLLLILVGEATKFSHFFIGMDKAYSTKVKLGEITQTYDAEGVLVEKRSVDVSCDDVMRVLGKFIGKLSQMPPPFSAKRIGGERAYNLARRGLKVDLKPVQVQVYRAELLSCQLPYVELYLEVSSGTYIRSLVHDIGFELSCGAHVVELRRLKVGRFTVEKAISYEKILGAESIEGFIIPIEEALDFMPEISLRGELSRRVRSGAKIRLREALNKTFVRLYADGNFIGVGLIEGNVLKPYRLMQGL